MNERPDEHPPLSEEQEALIERVAEHYAPPPLSAARRALLDTELRDRIATPRGLAFARPAFASAVVGLAVGLVLVLGGLDSTPPEDGRPGVLAADASSAAAWERDLFDPESLGEFDAASDLDELPDDYAAIAGIFLDG